MHRIKLAFGRRAVSAHAPRKRKIHGESYAAAEGLDQRGRARCDPLLDGPRCRREVGPRGGVAAAVAVVVHVKALVRIGGMS